jgi:predicted nucleic acid-binding Zn ribbon protein
MARPRIYATRDDYLAAHREYTIVWREQRRARGECPQCGDPWDGPEWECSTCRDKNSAQRKRRRQMRRITMIVLGTLALVAPASAAERTIEGWVLEAMIQQDPELNPCRKTEATDFVVVNPIAFYVEIEDGQKEKGIVNQLSIDVRVQQSPNEPLAGAVQTFPASDLAPVPGHVGCYRKAWTPPSTLAKDNTTRYIGRLRGENTAGPVGPWTEMNRPFRLAAIGTEPIRAVRGRFTGVQ